MAVQHSRQRAIITSRGNRLSVIGGIESRANDVVCQEMKQFPKRTSVWQQI